MRIMIRKVGGILKAIIVYGGITAALLAASAQSDLNAVKQSFDLRTSAVVSLGFGTTLYLFIQAAKKR